MGARIDQKSQKKPEKGIPKIMPKFDAEKKLKSWILHAIWIHVGDAGGKGAGRFWLILSDNAMTPAGVGGFWDPWKI